jgi:dTDP-4-amino-4,6-dideoxygalactose transaminase
MISVFGSNISEKEINGVIEVMKSNWLGFGNKVNEFEKKFSQKLGTENFCMVDSGSNALFMAVKLLDLPPNSDIILPSFTWVSCAQAILMAGHNPVFCDVELDSMNASVKTIATEISKNTKAIMIVHYAGKPVDLNPIMELGLPVIEDAAHAVDSYYFGKACGSISDVGIFSFDAVKNLTAGEGGGVCTRDAEKILKAKTMRYCGIGKSGFEAASSSNSNNKWWEYNIVEPFIKMLPTNIAATIASIQLDRLESLQKRRKDIWDTYQKEFACEDWIIKPVEANENEKHSYFTYVIRTPKRDELAKHLFNNGIYTTLRYHPLHLNDLYKSKSKLKNTELLNLDALSIPLHPNLSDEDVQYIILNVRNFRKFI